MAGQHMSATPLTASSSPHTYILPTHHKPLQSLCVCLSISVYLSLCLSSISFFLLLSGDSASITLACCGSVSFFSAVCEPLLLRQPFSQRDLAVGVLVLAGILFIYVSLPSSSAGEEEGGGRVVHYEAAVFTGKALRSVV